MKLAWSIVIVAVLGGFAIWASRKWLPKVTAPKGKKIQVIETVQLGHQRSLHIINVGTQKFLISSAPESVRMLADVTLAMEEERR
jgi:flagellar biogenesis protein FliO